MATYTKLEDTVNNRKIQVESAIRDGEGKNIQNNYAKQDGYYQGLTAGLSENFNTNLSIDDNSAYLFRTSGGALEITNNDRLKSVIGGTIVMNQMLPISSVASTTKTGVTFTNDNDGSWTIDTGSGSATDNAYLLTHSNLTYKGGHIYLLKGNMGNGSSSTFYLADNYAGNYVHQDYGYGCIFIASYNISNVNIALRVLNGTAVDNVKITPQLIDLTQMFGSTIANYINTLETNNARAGVAFVKQLLPNNYYAYNTGSFVNVKTTAKKVIGFNAYNNDTGTAKLLGGNIYQITGTYTSLSYVNILGKSETITPNGSGKFTPTYNGTLTIEGGSTDTCVHLVWDGERDGEFEEYKETTYPIEDIELRGVPKLDGSNNLYYDGDEYKSDGTVKRRYGIRDLGTISWSKGTNRYNATGVISNMKTVSNGNTMPNFVCMKYEVTSYNSVFNANGRISIHNSNNLLYISDNSGMTEAEFKTSLSGVYLVYELETPTTETANLFTENQIVDNWGTEEFIDTRDIKVLVGNKTEYLPDLKAKLEVAPDSPENDGYYVMKRDDGVNSYSLLSSWLINNDYKPDLQQITDLTSTSKTITLASHTRYALGTLTALNITFPSTGSDGDTIIIEFISGSTATTLTRDTTNAIYNFDDVSADKFIEFNAEFKVSIGKWVVYSAETDYQAV